MSKITKVGRPSLYNRQITEIIAKHLKEGMFREDAARLAGISPQTMYSWMDKHPEFVELMESAEGKNKANLVRMIERHGKKSWQALAWLLERRHKQDYHLASATLISGTKDGISIAVVQGGYTPPLKPTPIASQSEKIEAKTEK